MFVCGNSLFPRPISIMQLNCHKQFISSNNKVPSSTHFQVFHISACFSFLEMTHVLLFKKCAAYKKKKKSRSNFPQELKLNCRNDTSYCPYLAFAGNLLPALIYNASSRRGRQNRTYQYFKRVYKKKERMHTFQDWERPIYGCVCIVGTYFLRNDRHLNVNTRKCQMRL